MKAKELRDLTRAELEQKRRELEEELFNYRFRIAAEELDVRSRIRKVRKELARVITVLREDKLGIHAVASSEARDTSRS
jgi:large subunit ribosomal protein L29